jgi:hypothetical protein
LVVPLVRGFLLRVRVRVDDLPAVVALAGGLRAADARLLPADAFARVAVDFFAPLLLAADRLAAGRFALDFREVPLRDEDERDVEPPELDPEPALASTVHLPDITRCAASATASAMSEPSLVALCITLLAAWLAVSAASRPASRIARRAFGLALIAAAAAARPAASISLLIAALASLSTVSLPDEEPEEPEEPLRADLAIASSPSDFPEKTIQGCNGSRTMPEVRIC